MCFFSCAILQRDEEEERRKRRREKNKVAAARCRNKKKERTDYLQKVRRACFTIFHIFTSSVVRAGAKFLLHISFSSLSPLLVLRQESERLEMLNSDLKAQIEELKLERQQLILMLNRHRPTCIVRTDSVKTPESEANPLLEQLEAKWRRLPSLRRSSQLAALRSGPRRRRRTRRSFLP